MIEVEHSLYVVSMALAKPDIKRTALIVVDVQEDFCPPVCALSTLFLVEKPKGS